MVNLGNLLKLQVMCGNQYHLASYLLLELVGEIIMLIDRNWTRFMLKVYGNMDQRNTLSGPSVLPKEIGVNKKEPIILYSRVSVPYKGILEILFSNVLTVRVEATSEH